MHGEGEKRKAKAGTITAFFSLVFLLIVVLIVTMAESARVTACSNAAELYVELSVKSLMSRYYLPLYENYHVFGRYCSELRENDFGVLEEEGNWYLEANATGSGWIDPQVFNMKIENVSVLTQNRGAWFFEQAVQYQKYQAAEDLLGRMLETSEQLMEAEQAGLVLQKSLETIEKSAAAEQTVFLLLECLDGFETDGTTLVQDFWGKVRTVEHFAKRIVPDGIRQELLLPGNNALYRAQRFYYCNPMTILHCIAVNRQQYEEMTREISRLNRLLTEENVWERYEDELTIRERMEEYSRQKEEYYQAYWNNLESLTDVTVKTKLKCEQALKLIDELNRQKKEAADIEKEYLEELELKKNTLPEEVYREIREQHRAVYEAVSKENEIGILKDIRGMQETLNQNIQVLLEAEDSAARLQAFPEAGECRTITGETSQIYRQLCMDTLRFSYDEIQLAQKNNSIAGMIKRLAKYGLVGLVLEDVSGISKGQMSMVELPTLEDGANVSQNTDTLHTRFVLSDLFEQTDDAWSLDEQKELKRVLAEDAEELAEAVLFQSYLTDHFAAYRTNGKGDDSSDETKQDAQSMTGDVEGIKYQLEYILFQNSRDYDNLADMITRIFAIRYAMNMMMLFCSSECRMQMKETAAALVGFTGIGALVVLMEFMIGALWAAECAVVETACLLRGGQVGFLPSSKACAVEYRELLLFSQNMIDQKAERNDGREASGVMKKYSDYLQLFLFLENRSAKILGAMDVAQQMLRLKYDSGFRLKYCVCGLECSAKARTAYRFLPSVGLGKNSDVTKVIEYGFSY